MDILGNLDERLHRFRCHDRRFVGWFAHVVCDYHERRLGVPAGLLRRERAARAEALRAVRRRNAEARAVRRG